MLLKLVEFSKNFDFFDMSQRNIISDESETDYCGIFINNFNNITKEKNNFSFFNSDPNLRDYPFPELSTVDTHQFFPGDLDTLNAIWKMNEDELKNTFYFIRPIKAKTEIAKYLYNETNILTERERDIVSNVDFDRIMNIYNNSEGFKIIEKQ